MEYTMRLREEGSTMKKLVHKFVFCLWAVVALEGCISIELNSPGDKVNDPLYNDYCWACLWCNRWWFWSDDPSSVCRIRDADSINVNNEYVYRPGYREALISYSWWTVFPSFGTLGLVVPFKVTVYKTKDDAASVVDDEPEKLN